MDLTVGIVADARRFQLLDDALRDGVNAAAQSGDTVDFILLE